MITLAYSSHNAQEFLAKAKSIWSADPVANNLQWALAIKFMKNEGPHAAAIFEEDGQHWVGLHTVPARPLILNGPATISDAGKSAIVNFFADAPGLTSTKQLSEQLAPFWNKRIVRPVAMFLYELSALDPKLEFTGKLKLATKNDRELLALWVEEFAVSIEERLFGRNYQQEADNMIERGQIRFLKIDNKIVSMAGSTRSEGGVACINYVYTPVHLRSRGYASSNVGLLSQELLQSHDRVCLYADEDYLASNRVYQKLGFQVVARTVELEFE